jgi:cysteine desulfurase/selenocysteine lyase
MLDVKKIREEFPILGQQVHGQPLVYLDSAATAQKPRVVMERMDWVYETINANIHRGVHHLSERSTEVYEAARETVRGFLNASSTDEIVFTAGATAAINTVAYSFGERFFAAGDNIIVSEMEHHSNLVPWQIVCARKGVEIRVLPFLDDGRLEIEKLMPLIDDRTRLVAVTQASNVLGTRPDLPALIAGAHSKGVPVMVDGCQGVVHGGVDVAALGCDFYAFSGHKLYGPTGIGVLYGKREWLDRMPPFMGGGDMVDRVSFEGTTYAALPLKFEAGTANYVGAAGLAAAIEWLQQFDSQAIEAHEQALCKAMTERLQAIGGVRIFGTQPDKCALVSFVAEGVHPYDMGMILDKMGIAIRTGTHCAEPVMTHYGLTAMCRASLAIYNTPEEVEIFATGVERALKMLR